MQCYDPFTRVYYPHHYWYVGPWAAMRNRCVRCRELDVTVRAGAAARAQELGAEYGAARFPSDGGTAAVAARNYARDWLAAWGSIAATGTPTEAAVTARVAADREQAAAEYASRCGIRPTRTSPPPPGGPPT